MNIPGYLKRIVTIASSILFILCMDGYRRNLHGNQNDKNNPGNIIEKKSLGDFEDGTTQGWFGDGDKNPARISLSGEHVVSGRKSLRVEFPPDIWPGIVLKLKLDRQDWSSYHALRMSVFNAEKTDVSLSVRIDDVNSNSYATRHNNDRGIKMMPGPNEVTIPVVGLRLPTGACRGLDTRIIREIHLFLGRKKNPVTMYFDDIHLVRFSDSKPEGTLILDDFDGKSHCKWGPSYEADTKIVQNPSGKDGNAVEIVFSDSKYPGIKFSNIPENWLTYDLFSFDIICLENTVYPALLSLKLMDNRGRSETFPFKLKKGVTRYAFPIQFVGHISLDRMDNIIFFGGGKGKKFLIDNVRLQNFKLDYYPPVHISADDKDSFVLNFNRMSQRGKNTGFISKVWLPLKSGLIRDIDFSSPGKDVLKYSLGKDAFTDYDSSKPARIWSAFKDHGKWHCTERQQKIDTAGQTEIAF